MWKVLKSIAGIFHSLFSWLGVTLKQSSASYCDVQTADSATTLVANDGSLLSVIRVEGVKSLIGRNEFIRIQEGLQQTLQTVMSQDGHTMQIYFNYNRDEVKDEITNILTPAHETAERLGLDLGDLFQERINYITAANTLLCLA